jgi:hypothetical protein
VLPRFPRQLIRRIESIDLPLQALRAVRELRRYLDAVEEAAILKARELRASPADIAQALGITRQGVYHKLRLIEARTHGQPVVVIPDVEREPEPERGRGPTSPPQP